MERPRTALSPGRTGLLAHAIAVPASEPRLSTSKLICVYLCARVLTGYEDATNAAAGVNAAAGGAGAYNVPAGGVKQAADKQVSGGERGPGPRGGLDALGSVCLGQRMFWGELCDRGSAIGKGRLKGCGRQDQNGYVVVSRSRARCRSPRSILGEAILKFSHHIRAPGFPCSLSARPRCGR